MRETIAFHSVGDHSASQPHSVAGAKIKDRRLMDHLTFDTCRFPAIPPATEAFFAAFGPAPPNFHSPKMGSSKFEGGETNGLGPDLVRCLLLR